MIRTERRGAVLVVTIDRPERRNALDQDAIAGLRAALDDAEATPPRVLALTGAGGHFCSGADLATVEDHDVVAALGEVLRGLRGAPFPTLAVVEGYALGAGTQLAIACDLRIAAADAVFGVPAARLGLMVDQWTVRRLVGLVGQSSARHLLLSTDRVGGAGPCARARPPAGCRGRWPDLGRRARHARTADDARPQAGTR